MATILTTLLEVAMELELVSVVTIALLHFAGYGLIALVLIRASRRPGRKAAEAKQTRPKPVRSWRRVVTSPRVIAHLCLLIAATTEVTVVLAVHLPQAIAQPAAQAA